MLKIPSTSRECWLYGWDETRQTDSALRRQDPHAILLWLRSYRAEPEAMSALREALRRYGNDPGDLLRLDDEQVLQRVAAEVELGRIVVSGDALGGLTHVNLH